jgi:hypothetical protein
MSTDKQKQEEFVKSLTALEKRYVWEHVYRYAGVEGVSADEQLKRPIEYVLNFLGGVATIEKRVFAKAMKMF